MSVEIEFSDLWTYSWGDDDTERRLPISELPGEFNHIHGRLTIMIDGRRLPSLGFFGPADVCFSEWVHELEQASTTLQRSETANYVYDEGEQGQPAFQFARKDGWLFVSIIASVLSGVDGDPHFTDVKCSFEDFVSEVARFLKNFKLELEKQASALAAAWWKRNVERAP